MYLTPGTMVSLGNRTVGHVVTCTHTFGDQGNSDCYIILVPQHFPVKQQQKTRYAGDFHGSYLHTCRQGDATHNQGTIYHVEA